MDITSDTEPFDTGKNAKLVIHYVLENPSSTSTALPTVLQKLGISTAPLSVQEVTRMCEACIRDLPEAVQAVKNGKTGFDGSYHWGSHEAFEGSCGPRRAHEDITGETRCYELVRIDDNHDA